MNQALATIINTLRGRTALLTIAALDLVHPLLHPFEGGALDPVIVWLNATAMQAMDPWNERNP